MGDGSGRFPSSDRFGIMETIYNDDGVSACCYDQEENQELESIKYQTFEIVTWK